MRVSAVFFLLLILPVATAFSQSVTDLADAGPFSVNPVISIDFTATDFVVHDYENSAKSKEVHEYPVTYEIVNKSLYIDLHQDVDFSSVSFSLSRGRYLVLYTEGFLALYNGDGKRPVVYCSPKSMWSLDEIRFFNLTPSSTLTEGGVSYDLSYLRNQWIGKAWAEGRKGPGIGESIRFDEQSDYFRDPPQTIAVAFVNGYVSFERPDLYVKNNRIKTLDVVDAKGNTIATVNFKDRVGITYFGFRTKSPTFSFVIKDVYRGTIYDDTCVSLIEPVFY